MRRQRLLQALLIFALLATTLAACGYSKSDLAAAEQRGYEKGYQDGYEYRFSEDFIDAYAERFGDTYREAYIEGFDDGYEYGCRTGSDTVPTEPEGGIGKIEKDK